MASVASATAISKIKSLDESTIYDLFGSFDAERERSDRFKEYFVTNDLYERFVADFPLRIAVGNKGTGKTAIIRRSLLEEQERPDFICVALNAADLGARAGDLPTDGLKAINHWKAVFAREAAGQILTSTISDKLTGDMSSVLSSLPAFISWVGRALAKKSGGASDLALKAGLDLNKIKKITFYIDDLDSVWNGRPDGLNFVNSLLNACYDITKNQQNIRFKLGFRWDLWDALSSINQNMDKIRQDAIFLRWTTHEIYVVVANRVAKFFGEDFPVDRYLKEESNQKEIEQIFRPILDPVFEGYGKWDGTTSRHVILSMTRNRPRDLLSLLTLAAQEAHTKRKIKIGSADLKAVFPIYSEQRLSDLDVEFGTRLSGLKAVLFSFKPSKSSGKATEQFRFTNDRITKHLQALLKEQGSKIRFTGEKSTPDWRRILDFLYRIDFLSGWYRSNDGSIERIGFQDRQLVVTTEADFGYSWEVLPAYRWAIQPTKIQDVIASLE